MAENWTNAHTLMYFLFGFSHLTDWKVTDEEKEESIRIAEKYFDGVSDWDSVYREVQSEYIVDLGVPNPTEEGLKKVQHLTIKCAEEWADSGHKKHKPLELLLKDAMSLAKADGNFDDTEKHLINALAKAWNVDVKVD